MANEVFPLLLANFKSLTECVSKIEQHLLITNGQNGNPFPVLPVFKCGR